jgi:hypothetical protein
MYRQDFQKLIMTVRSINYNEVVDATRAVSSK